MEKRDVIGIIPAGGYGTRMAPFKVWKELIHVGYKEAEINNERQLVPKVVAEYTVEGMADAGAKQIIMILNEQKYELFKFFGNGSNYGTNISYTCQDTNKLLTGMPVAMDTAYYWLKDKTVFMGMPDTIVEPFDAFKSLYQFHLEKAADLTIGVLPTSTPTRLAPVLIDKKTSHVLNIYDKPKFTKIYNTWNIAIWSPKFTELMHEYVLEAEKSVKAKTELLLTDVFLKAIDSGLEVYGHMFEEGHLYDLGDIKQFVACRLEIEREILLGEQKKQDSK